MEVGDVIYIGKLHIFPEKKETPIHKHVIFFLFEAMRRFFLNTGSMEPAIFMIFTGILPDNLRWHSCQIGYAKPDLHSFKIILPEPHYPSDPVVCPGHFYVLNHRLSLFCRALFGTFERKMKDVSMEESDLDPDRHPRTKPYADPDPHQNFYTCLCRTVLPNNLSLVPYQQLYHNLVSRVP